MKKKKNIDELFDETKGGIIGMGAIMMLVKDAVEAAEEDESDKNEQNSKRKKK